MDRFLTRGLMFTKSLSYVNIKNNSYHPNIIYPFENRRIIGSLNNYDNKIGAGVFGQPECRDIIKSDCSIIAADSIKNPLEDFNKKSVSVDVATIRCVDTSYDGTNQ